MYLNQAKQHLQTLLAEKIPVFLWGPPGIGKSSIVQQIAQELNWQLIDLRLSLLNPVDLRGLPYLDKDKGAAVWLKPEFLPTQGQGILFLDELNTAPVSVQIAAYQLLLDRKLGNYVFPEGWRIVAAGNRETDGASVTKLPSPLANRLLHLDIEASLEDWKIWAEDHVDSRVIAFLNFRPKLLATLPKEEQKAYPTPRSWQFVSQILQLYADPNLAEEAIVGAVGEGAAKEFLAYLPIYQDLPDIDGILEGRVSTIPAKADIKHAVCQALVTKLKKNQIDNFLNYTLKLDPEFATLVVRDAAKKGKGWERAIMDAKTWKIWADKFVEYL